MCKAPGHQIPRSGRRGIELLTAVCGRAVIELLGDGAPGRHREVERRAAAQRALDLDTSAVGLDEALADLQTKSRSAALGFLCLPESVEDVREALGCNASAGVCDPKSYFAVAGRCPYGDATERNSVAWMTAGPKDWRINLDDFRAQFDVLESLTWLTGTIRITPELENEAPRQYSNSTTLYESALAFYITEEEISAMSTTMSPTIPIEITASLEKFRKDYPDPCKVAFIMMRFGSTSAHDKITTSIRGTLATYSINGLRADDKQYHDDLFWNVMTYIYGCSFGISVFERLEAEEFNPNVSLEVGYMLALGKPICLLKDKTLKTLHADLVGKLYKAFDPQDPSSSIPPQLDKWLKDKELAH